MTIQQAANTRVSMLSRVKFAMESDTLNALVQSLRTEQFSIKDIVEGGRTYKEYESRDPTRESANAVRYFDRLRACAVSLGRGVSCFGEHDCAGNHKAIVRLDQRVTPSRKKSKSMDDVAGETMFSLFLLAGDECLQEIVVSTQTPTGSRESCK